LTGAKKLGSGGGKKGVQWGNWQQLGTGQKGSKEEQLELWGEAWKKKKKKDKHHKTEK